MTVTSSGRDPIGARRLWIPRSVSALEFGSFAPTPTLEAISFEIFSKLRQFDPNIFRNSGLRSLVIPQFIKSFVLSASQGLPASLCLSFEPNSQLTRLSIACSEPIQALVVPPSVESLDFRLSGTTTLVFERGSTLLQLNSLFLGREAYIREWPTFGERLQAILVPRSVEVLGSYCFALSALSSLYFEQNSELREIRKFAFGKTRLQRMRIPARVRFIHGSAFHQIHECSIDIEMGQKRFIVIDDLLVDDVEHKLIREFSMNRVVLIPREIEILGPYCFNPMCVNFKLEPNSRLKRMEEFDFAESVRIPSTVTFLVPRILQYSKWDLAYSVEPAPGSRFALRGGMLIDTVEKKLVCASGAISDINIPPTIEIVGPRCFGTFCDECGGYYQPSGDTTTRTISIPKNVQVLCKHCFDCCHHELVLFMVPSNLRRIEKKVFTWTSTSPIVIPPTVHFIASEAFTRPSMITVQPLKSELNRWRSLRMSGFESDFRRIVRLKSALKCLDLTMFTREESSGFYRRISDGVLVVVKSLIVRAKQPLYKTEIENLLSLNHPCICAPFGFRIPEGGEPFLTARLHVAGPSLSQVIASRPDWWTPNAKALAIAGVVLGMRFMHSFGLIHGNLKPQNILFDEFHRIQICDISLNRISLMDPSEAMGFGGGKWNPAVDIMSFASILFTVITGSPVPEDQFERTQALAEAKVRRFVSSFIQSAFERSSPFNLSFFAFFRNFKKNYFRIIDGVDSEEVFDFVRDIESFEKSRD
jgi:hypothetical protein